MMRLSTSYLICATPRSGSYLLCEALNNTGVAGRPTEYVSQTYEGYWAPRWNTLTYRDYIDKCIEIGTTSNGVFGVKAHLHQLNYFMSKLRQIPEYQEVEECHLLSMVFPNLHYLWIMRRDKVRQAVSYLRANQTNIWWLTDQPPAPFAAPTPERLRFDFATLDRMVQRMEREEASWKNTFNAWGIKPMVVVYEELAEAYEESALQVLNYLKIPMPKGLVFAEPRMKKQADSISEEWVQRYNKLKRAQTQRTLAAYQNIHQGERIVVCGCGESLNTFGQPEQSITIGVNDVGRRFQPNYLVIVDPKEKFVEERFHYVETSQANVLFVNRHMSLPHPNIVRFILRQKEIPDFSDPNNLYYIASPWYSPYVALCLAVHMGASRIGMVGVDFADNHFFGQTGPYPGIRHLSEVERQFRLLNDVLITRGVKVFNLSRSSRIKAFPKMLQEDLEAKPASTAMIADARKSLRIISYATEPLGGVPAMLAHCINARTPHYARFLCSQNDDSDGDFKGDINWNEAPYEAEAELAKADVVIIHNGLVEPSHRSLFAGKAIITLAHACSGNVDQTFVKQGFPGAVLGQWSAIFPESRGWTVIPYPIPLWKRTYRPVEKDDMVVIAYTPNNNPHSPDHIEGPDVHLHILEKLARQHPMRLEVIDERHLSQTEAMERKQRAHVVIDECRTGSYHPNSLQGLAVGCVVVNGLGRRAEALEAFRHCAGGVTSNPFIYSCPERLENVITSLLRRGTESLIEEGLGNREWVEQHWNFDWQWEQLWLPLLASALRVLRGKEQVNG